MPITSDIINEVSKTSLSASFGKTDIGTMWVKTKRAVGELRKSWGNARIASRFRKSDALPNLESGYRIIGDISKPNGLSRAFRYEVERLTEAGLLSKTSQNFLILGQPRQYRKLLASPPAGFAEGYRIGLWVTEFEIFPPDLLFALDIVHEIWTPSTFSARAIRSVTDLPIKVVPHAVRIKEGPAMGRAQWGVSEDQFLGIAIMDLGTCPDRKNPLGHIAAWQYAFGNDEGVHLLMKVRFSRSTEFARTALQDAIKSVLNITLIEQNFDDESIAAFQRMADVYLSLHRSEGYGLNIQEMLELGKPVIATGYSGNMDFMPHYDRAHAIPYNLVPYADRTLHYRGKGLKWAEPDLSAAAAMLVEERDKWTKNRFR